MRQKMKYKVRRLIAALVLVGIFMLFTVSVLVKGIDGDIQRQDRILEEHFQTHGIGK